MKKISIFCAISALFSAFSTAQAANFNPTTAADFQAALTSAASNGENDTISLPAGDFNISGVGNSTFLFNSSENFSLSIEGAGPSATTLDGNDSKLVLSLESSGGSGANISVSNLGIVNGNGTAFAQPGGLSIDISGQGSAFVSGLSFQGNDGGSGGGLFISTQSGGLSVVDSTFTGNTADNDGGGFYLYSTSGSVSVDGVAATSNQAASTYAGGYIACLASCSVANSTFSSNSISDGTGSAGGLAIASNGGQIQLNQLTLQNNSTGSDSSDAGGGLFITLLGTGSLSLTNSTISGNHATNVAGLYAILGDSATATLTGNTISQNVATNIGGGGGMQGGSSLSASSNVVQGNSASLLAGLSLSSNGNIAAVNNVVTGNTASGQYAGFAFSSSGTITATNNTVANNSTPGDGGGMFFAAFSDSAVFNIYNNIAYGNSAGNGDDIFVDPDTFNPTVKLFNNDFSEFCLGSTCDASTLGANQGGNINADPLFANASAGDFDISSGSPVIDAGSASAPDLPSTDIAGNSRPQGSAPDMGAYEFVPSAPGGGGCAFTSVSSGSWSAHAALLILFLGLLAAHLRARLLS